MVASFVHDIQSQRVVFAPGAVARVAEEAARLGLSHALVIATPGSGARLGGRIVDILGGRAAGLHAQAALHVPKPVAEMGIAAARRADGLVAVGGGAAIGLAKIIARISACRSSRFRPLIPDRKRPRFGGSARASRNLPV